MPLSPSRTAGARPVQNVSNAPLDKSSHEGKVSPQVKVPLNKQLGFTPPQQRPSTALQPLGAPSADFKVADDAPRQEAAPSSPGPLKAAVARLLKSGHKTHYMVFRNGELTLVKDKPKGLGLGKPEQHKEFCNLIVAELVHMQPKEASSAELKAFQASAHALAKAFVNRALQQLGNDINGNNIQLGGLLKLLPQLSEMYGKPPSELDAGTAILRNSANSGPSIGAAYAPESKTHAPSDVRGRPKPGAVDPGADEKSAAVRRLRTGLFGGLLVQFKLVEPFIGAPGYPEGKPFTVADMNELMDCMMREVFMFDSHIARMLDAVHDDPSLSDHALRHANRIRQDLTIGHSRTDRLAGAGLPATALLLSLPPERLKQMFLTRAQVERLAEEAYVVLSHLPSFMDSAGTPSAIQRIHESISSPQPEDAPRMVSQIANAFIDTPGGGKIANQFTSALQILLHNAERLEAFADLDDAPDEQLEHESASIFLLLQEYVPADFDNARRIDLHAQPGTERPLLTLAEEPPMVLHVEAQVPPIETKIAPNPSKPAAHRPVDAPARVAANTRATRSAPNVDTQPAGNPRVPGAKRRNPAKHFHPRDHRALSNDQFDRRTEMLRARELGLIVGDDKWTPELRSLLQNRSRVRRMAEQGTTNISAGQRLIRPHEVNR